MKKRLFLSIILLFTIKTIAAEKYNIICTTTHLSSIVNELIPDNSNISTIIPSGMCPGHFDLSPGEVQRLNNADMVFYHGYEHFIHDLHLSENTKLIKIHSSGNLMVPQNHIKAAIHIASVLLEKYPDLVEIIQPNLNKYVAQINLQENEIIDKLNSFKNTPVVCASINKEFVQWLGANIVATFPRDEDISLNSMHKIMTLANKKKIVLVIDNLQSSGKVGKTFAEELKVPLMMLSNFPENNSYLETLQTMCDKIIESLEKLNELCY